jgi:hypothetical protein
MLVHGAAPKPEDVVTADKAVKDPYVLEFLDLKDEYSESDLEHVDTAAEGFLLELGDGFSFVGRQSTPLHDMPWRDCPPRSWQSTIERSCRMLSCSKRNWRIRDACWNLAPRSILRHEQRQRARGNCMQSRAGSLFRVVALYCYPRRRRRLSGRMTPGVVMMG